CEEGGEFRQVGLRGAGGIAAFGALGARAAAGPAFAAAGGAFAFGGGFAALGGSLGFGRRGSLTLGSGGLGLGLSRLLAALLLLLEGLARLGRSEPVVDRGEIVVEIVLFGLELVATELGLLRLLGRRDDAEIMLGVLQVILGHDAVARGLRIAGELQVFLGDMGRVAAHLHVGAVALVIAAQRVAVLAAAIVVAPTGAVLVVLLVWSHRLFSSLG